MSAPLQPAVPLAYSRATDRHKNYALKPCVLLEFRYRCTDGDLDILLLVAQTLVQPTITPRRFRASPRQLEARTPTLHRRD